jgi:hypothetical protein
LRVSQRLRVRDADWLHCTTPVRAAEASESGQRDVVLISAAPGALNRYTG